VQPPIENGAQELGRADINGQRPVAAARLTGRACLQILRAHDSPRTALAQASTTFFETSTAKPIAHLEFNVVGRASSYLNVRRRSSSCRRAFVGNNPRRRTCIRRSGRATLFVDLRKLISPLVVSVQGLTTFTPVRTGARGILDSTSAVDETGAYGRPSFTQSRPSGIYGILSRWRRQRTQPNSKH